MTHMVRAQKALRPSDVQIRNHFQNQRRQKKIMHESHVIDQNQIIQKSTSKKIKCKCINNARTDKDRDVCRAKDLVCVRRKKDRKNESLQK